MKVLLTGSTGFLGSYLKTFLEKTHNVFAPTHKELDLADPRAVETYLKQEYFDVVIHAAVAGRELVQSHDHNIVDQNLQMFFNLYSNKDHYNKFITFGSGAEFGLDRSIDNFSEDHLLECFPKESYGFSKNIIARTIRNTENFYNLRFFSCFHPSESDKRLLKKFIQSVKNRDPFFIDEDRYVDFIGLHDIALVIEAVLNGSITERDINVVYKDKVKVSELLVRYCELHSINSIYVQVRGRSNINYTGNGDKLEKFNIKLDGLDESLKKYLT
jgi:GDP-L-fucose synthase